MRLFLRNVLFSAAMLSLFLFAGCTKSDTGKVVGVKARMSLGELAGGEVSDMYYEGALVLEKSNGEQVEALCDTSLIKHIRGGQVLEIKFDKALDSWKVARIVSEPE